MYNFFAMSKYFQVGQYLNCNLNFSHSKKPKQAEKKNILLTYPLRMFRLVRGVEVHWLLVGFTVHFYTTKHR